MWEHADPHPGPSVFEGFELYNRIAALLAASSSSDCAVPPIGRKRDLRPFARLNSPGSRARQLGWQRIT